MASTTQQTDADADEQEPYFDDSIIRSRELADRKAEIDRRVRVIEELDKLVARIDQNDGYGSLSVSRTGGSLSQNDPSEETFLHVSITAPNLSQRIREVAEEYEWPLRFEIQHDTEDSMLRWEMKTTVGTLLDAEADD